MSTRKLLKKTLQVTAVSTAVAALFGLYLVVIGIPRTQARNYYNKGIVAIQQGNLREGESDFQTAVGYWPEAYIQTELSRLQQLSD